ncbi:Putative oxoglutarate/iron-dependent dioxygenase, non-hem dioxygenase domain-containing protein [Septoria linicola]|uniref:Oxoglutarate/iron-dependent dioxygenase, non-hem dioxygenase domain-containing protein n=1 Tax=Septoria linicola TaxID=215465 RepID=A0A9Q9AQP7_9PEZI|nr:putative oxoglutarate/iron-dependent dioxygenase, non-hem dioxygenase domain-containing protein [Septoria linicola]USW50316.1 Putative oxoglutarate/iron-dependent dioxygenase, non-hem dioxygenase domain-containing protein [Septoria linicola]
MKEFTSFSGRKRPLASNDARKAEFHEIPTISLAVEEQVIIEQLRDACTRVGFFYIKDHGVSQEIIDCVFDTAKRFFDQPGQTKNEINYKKSKVLHGYEPISEVRTDETKRADLNEAFNCGYEPDLDPVDNGPDRKAQSANPMEGPNAWPAMSGFKQNVTAYYGEVLMLARRIVRLFAKVLDLDEDYFDSAMATPGAMLRLLKYPAQDPREPDALGIGAHTDIEAFTILCQGTQPALQILNVDGQWIQAPPVPGTFVVNIGDMLARWSNDVFISTVHRVHNCTGAERYSIPFFMGPSYDTMLRPLPTCLQRDGKAKYEPILAGEYVWKRLSQSRLSDAERQSVGQTVTTAVA